MSTATLTADYLVIGAGVTGLPRLLQAAASLA